MGFLKRKSPAAAGGAVTKIDPTLPDEEWAAASERLYDDTIRHYYGSPETMAAGGKINYDAANFGTAMLFYRKAIDMLHSAYGFSHMQSRRPSDADAPIIDGFCNSLYQTLDAHSNAPVVESVEEVTHRLRSISTECDGTGISSQLYRRGLDVLGRIAPQVNVDHVFWT